MNWTKDKQTNKKPEESTETNHRLSKLKISFENKVFLPERCRELVSCADF